MFVRLNLNIKAFTKHFINNTSIKNMWIYSNIISKKEHKLHVVHYVFDMIRPTVCRRCVCECEKQHNFQTIIIEINWRTCLRKTMLTENNLFNTTKV